MTKSIVYSRRFGRKERSSDPSVRERIRAAGNLPPAAAVDALLQLRRELHESNAWVRTRLIYSPAGLDLRTWEALAVRWGYRPGWARHRHREALTMHRAS